jgi:hypothetical protein
MAQENVCLMKTSLEQWFTRVMGRGDVLHVQGLEKSEMFRVAYAMGAENVGVAKGRENVRDVKVLVE